jgi:hypothetical protein
MGSIDTSRITGCLVWLNLLTHVRLGALKIWTDDGDDVDIEWLVVAWTEGLELSDKLMWTIRN